MLTQNAYSLARVSRPACLIIFAICHTRRPCCCTPCKLLRCTKNSCPGIAHIVCRMAERMQCTSTARLPLNITSTKLALVEWQTQGAASPFPYNCTAACQDSPPEPGIYSCAQQVLWRRSDRRVCCSCFASYSRRLIGPGRKHSHC